MSMSRICNATNADTCWTVVADAMKMDKDVINKCVAEEGLGIMKDEQKITSGALNVRGTPTIYINGIPYDGARDTQSLLNAMCAEYDAASKPSVCGTVLVSG
jgi:protein-disulfide isomerase